MRTVKIIQGTYGYKPAGARHISPRNHASEPFELPDDEAARIVGLGVAVYVAASAVATTADGPDDDRIGENMPGNQSGVQAQDNGEDALFVVDSHFTAESLNAMTKANLSKLAENLGANVSKCKTKAEMVSILTAIEVEDAADDDSDQPPTPGAEDPVS